MAIGISSFDADALNKERERIENMCKEGSKGITSLCFTKDDIKELEKLAKQKRNKQSEDVPSCVEAIYAVAAARDSKICTCSRKYARALGLQNKLAGIFGRWLLIANTTNPEQ